MKTVKLATFNINGIRSRLPSLLKWLARERPEIVCLQELKAPDDAFPFAALRAAGYGAVWHGQRAWNGVARFLAWIRAAIAVMAFGVLLEHFDLFLAHASHMTGKIIRELHVRTSEWLGLALLLFGALVIWFASVRFNQNRQSIDNDEVMPHGARRLERNGYSPACSP